MKFRSLQVTFFGAAGAFLLATVAGCGSDSAAKAGTDGGGVEGDGAAPGGPARGFSKAAHDDLVASGVGKYFGKATPASETSTGNVTEYFFDSANDGPVCFQGSQYTVLTRDQGSDNLIIFLEGGGACWTGLCAAKVDTSHGVPSAGLLDPTADTNVVADWNVVYVPYCDGSSFLGDNEVADATMPDGKRRHYGIRNLTAAIDVAKAQFPDPKRILLAGSSAGGYGTITGTGVVRLAYPTTELMVFNDAGLGLDNAASPASQVRKDEWQFLKFVPSTCTGCVEDPSKVVAWGLENDPSLRVAGFSAYEDAVIGGVFLGLTPADFKALLLQKTGVTQDAFPDRFKRFLVEGALHTTLMSNEDNSAAGLHGYLTVVDGVSVSDWTRAFVEGTADWTDRLENGGQ